MSPVKCDECSKEFVPALVEDPDGLQWFACPHCGRVYEVARVSLAGKKIRKQLATLRKTYRNTSGQDAVKVYRRIKRLEKQMAKEVTKLT